MADKKYYLPAYGQLVEVSREVYQAFYQMADHEKYLVKKDKKKGKVLFSDLDTEGTVGEAMLPTLGEVNIEDLAIANLMKAKLRRSLALLPPKDQELIDAIFYEGLSEREYAKRIGVSQNTVNKRKHSIIKELQYFFKK